MLRLFGCVSDYVGVLSHNMLRSMDIDNGQVKWTQTLSDRYVYIPLLFLCKFLYWVLFATRAGQIYPPKSTNVIYIQTYEFFFV